MLLAPTSATYIIPAESKAIAVGYVNLALVPMPSTTPRLFPFPANVVVSPAVVTRRMQLLAWSAQYTSPERG